MLPESVKSKVISFLTRKGERPAELLSQHAVSGGSINEAYHLKTSRGSFFLKYNDASRYPGMFEKEARGLQLLAAPDALDVPEVLLAGEAGNYAFLLLEYVEEAGTRRNFWDDFAKGLAALHQQKADRFGLDHDNYMGSLYQHNNFHDDWTEFFIEERLERQLKLARDHNKAGRSETAGFERLYRRLNELIPATKPSLIHGDLWSGNFMVNSEGRACLIDPAVYYGHPETDLAMSTLFGGFSEKFYDAYNTYHPLEKGWRDRMDIYNLYPLMVHVNLFGGGYLGSVQRILRRF